MRTFEKKPSKRYRFFLYDPEGEGIMYFQTAEIRDALAAELLSEYKDMFDGWNDEVEYMARGEVTEFPQVRDRVTRPPAYEIGADGCDSTGISWPEDVEWYGNYTWEKCDVETR